MLGRQARCIVRVGRRFPSSELSQFSLRESGQLGSLLDRHERFERLFESDRLSSLYSPVGMTYCSSFWLRFANARIIRRFRKKAKYPRQSDK
jgi:hypothetical protein